MTHQPPPWGKSLLIGVDATGAPVYLRPDQWWFTQKPTTGQIPAAICELMNTTVRFAPARTSQVSLAALLDPTRGEIGGGEIGGADS